MARGPPCRRPGDADGWVPAGERQPPRHLDQSRPSRARTATRLRRQPRNLHRNLRQQARVDAQLTLGADVVATAPPGALARTPLLQRIARLHGVAGVSAVDHSYAYVGPDLQDTFGVDPSTLPRATSLRDSYFLGGSSAHMLERLRTRRDGILVSKETITDYSLNLGDLLRLRVLDHRTGRFRIVPFHVVGIVQEFPSAPKDSFMVTNLGYLRALTRDPGPNVVFVRASGDPDALARRVAAVTAGFGATVKSISQQTAQTVSSITTVDLRGISRIEEGLSSSSRPRRWRSSSPFLSPNAATSSRR